MLAWSATSISATSGRRLRSFHPRYLARTSAPNILIATTNSLESTAPAVRAVLAETGREYAREIVTVEELFAGVPASERMMATLAGVMGGLAVLLAAIGIQWRAGLFREPSHA